MLESDLIADNDHLVNCCRLESGKIILATLKKTITFDVDLKEIASQAH